MYEEEDVSQVPGTLPAELQVPMPDHLTDPTAEEQLTVEQTMEQVPMTPEEAGFGSLAEVIKGTQATHDQVAADMGWPHQLAA